MHIIACCDAYLHYSPSSHAMDLLFFIFPCLALSLLTIKILSYFSSNNKKKTLPLPPSPPSLPILGHLHLCKKPLHRALARIAASHGPALLLRFGSRPVLIVSSLSLAEECFTKNDIAFASRPQLPSSRSLSYKYTTLASAPYGPHWRNVRRIATVELLSSARIHSLSDVRQSEVKSVVYDLFGEFNDALELKKVELRPRLFGLAFNVMMRMIAGKRCEGSEEARRFREVVEESLAVIGASSVSDFLPAVLRVVLFGGVKRRMRRVKARTDAMLQGLIDEERKKEQGRGGDEAGETGEKNKKNMLQVLLDLQAEDPEYYNDEIIKAMIVTLFFAGTDTSTQAIEWAMTLLLNHPEILHKARNEIDSCVGDRRRLLQEHDLSNLPYLQAIISETLRLCPATPLLVPHESLEDCTVGGYGIPRGTMLLVNAWAIHRDPAMWADPTEFRPERFMDGGGKTIPFGMGRRRCPGDGLAMRLVGLVLGTMIQCFEWERIGEELIDMEEKGGITLQRAKTLQGMCRPRQIMVDVLSQSLNS